MTSFTIIDGDDSYTVDLVPDEQENTFRVETDERYCYLLLAGIPGENGLEQSHAVLGSRKALGNLELLYECRAIVKKHDGEGDGSAIPVEFLPADTFWIVQ